MTQQISFLTWMDQPGQTEPGALVTVDFGVDLDWVIQTFGEYHYTGLQAKWVVVDNSANAAVVTVQCGVFTYSIDQYARKSIFIQPNNNFVRVQGTTGTVQCQFLIINRNPNLEGANDFLIQQAIAAATASLVGQTVGPIINPAFDVWPQGAGPFASINMQYGPEGHMTTRNGLGGNVQLSRVAGDIGGTYAAKVQRIAADANLSPIYFGTQMLSIDSKPFAGKTVTFSVYLKAGANFSAAGSTVTLAIINGTGNDQNMFSGGFTGVNVVATQNATLTAGTTRFAVSGAVPSNATQLGFQIYYTPTGVAGADDSFTVQLEQIDLGSTPQAYRPVPYPLELQRCEFFYEVFAYDKGNEFFAIGGWNNAVNLFVDYHYERKRIAPTVTLSALGDFNASNVIGGVSTMASLTPTNIDLANFHFFGVANVGIGGGGLVAMLYNANNNARLTLNARM